MSSTLNIFINKDGTITLSSSLILLGLPMWLSGRWIIAAMFITCGGLLALCQAMDTQISSQDKNEIRYNVMDAFDVVEELVRLEHQQQEDNNNNNGDSPEEQPQSSSRSKCTLALAALAKKCNKERRRAEQKLRLKYLEHELELLCQAAAYIVFRLHPDFDDTVAAALSLLALVAKDDKVRERHIHEADIYGLNIPIEAMRRSLNRAKRDDEPPDEQTEQQSAELQRKGCLLLGALADGDKDMATQIVDEKGLEVVLDAVKWYRYHEDVANWSLWATFSLCYDHPVNKHKLLGMGGIQTILQTLTNIPDSLEVARHGIAILFDMLRDVPEHPNPQLPQIRKAAISAGLHSVIIAAMEEFDESTEINMMGQEMMAATGYLGDLPQYRPMS